MFMNKIFSVKTNLCEDGTERILLGDVVHGFRQVTNIARGDSSHGNSAILKKNMFRKDSKSGEIFTLVRYTEWSLMMLPTCSAVMPVKQNIPI